MVATAIKLIYSHTAAAHHTPSSFFSYFHPHCHQTKSHSDTIISAIFKFVFGGRIQLVTGNIELCSCDDDDGHHCVCHCPIKSFNLPEKTMSRYGDKWGSLDSNDLGKAGQEVQESVIFLVPQKYNIFRNQESQACFYLYCHVFLDNRKGFESVF